MGSFLTDNPPSKHFTYRTTSFDIRAPRRLQLLNLSRQQKKVIPIMLLGDVIALAIAWQVTNYFNQFYSPLPPELLWWTWLGIPSLFWIFAVLTIVSFAYGGLYDSFRNNYVRGAKLITGV